MANFNYNLFIIPIRFFANVEGELIKMSLFTFFWQ